jgi:hypothetical protein
VSKLTQQEKEHFKRLVLDCIIQRLTTVESQLCIKDKLKIEVGVDYIKKPNLLETKVDSSELDTSERNSKLCS